jgi:hypothetical protein
MQEWLAVDQQGVKAMEVKRTWGMGSNGTENRHKENLGSLLHGLPRVNINGWHNH